MSRNPYSPVPLLRVSTKTGAFIFRIRSVSPWFRTVRLSLSLKSLPVASNSFSMFFEGLPM